MQLAIVVLLLPGQPFVPGVAEQVDRELRGQTLASRRARRDEALKHVGGGEAALRYTQDFAEDGVRSLLACEPGTGERLVSLHADGKLPRPLVASVARYGEEVGAWVAEHHDRLADPAALQAFLKEPREYVWNLKALPTPPPEARDAQVLLRRYWKEGLLAAGVPLFLLLAWRKRRAGP